MKILSILALFFAFSSLQAQQIWSLKDCINHALKNNISLKQSKLNIQLNESKHLQSKMELLPSINTNSSINSNSGRYLDKTTYQYVENSALSSDFSLSANTKLFDGFKNINQIKKTANESLKSIYDLESAKNDLISSIALSYLQILFNKELYQTAAKQLDLTKNLENRMIILVESGSIARGELLNIQSRHQKSDVFGL